MPGWLRRPYTVRAALLVLGGWSFGFASSCAQANTDDLDRPALGGDASSSNDRDGDGFAAEVDCDDNDRNRYPGAVERCDGIDQNCNDEIDDNAQDAVLYYSDMDGDGFGDPATMVKSCRMIAGKVTNSRDCYDQNAEVRPDQSLFFMADHGDGSFDYNCS